MTTLKTNKTRHNINDTQQQCTNKCVRNLKHYCSLLVTGRVRVVQVGSGENPEPAATHHNYRTSV